ncbi:MAG: hypothetical protein H6814_08440 [Phycisphaeraceae bacterium]|nr:hypothetical protein [Phycisphaeraceae bacterium]
MPSEKQWVASLVDRLRDSLNDDASKAVLVGVEDARRLTYAYEVYRYSGTEPIDMSQAGYQTDLLVYDMIDDEQWIPRIVIEMKLGSVTTHDALTYSSKASTHKNVHPYLRYGIVVGNWGDYPLPPRLFRHGAYFDFMMTWAGTDQSLPEWSQFIKVLKEEIEASRNIQDLLSNAKKHSKKKYHLVHRKLAFL